MILYVKTSAMKKRAWGYPFWDVSPPWYYTTKLSLISMLCPKDHVLVTLSHENNAID